MEFNKVYLGDSAEVLRGFPDECIDVVITSPPYNKAGYEGFIRTSSRTDAWARRNIDYDGDASNDFMPESEYELWQISLLNECFRVCREGASLFYNHKVRMAHNKSSHPIEWLLKTEWTFRQQIIWDRGSTPALAPIRFLPTTELIFWMTKGAVSPRFKRKDYLAQPTEVWRFKPEIGSEHPAPFPETIPTNILTNFPKESIVLDPFSGSGTTLVAAKKLNMPFIGIEKIEKYKNIAEDRLRRVDSEPNLF